MMVCHKKLGHFRYPFNALFFGDNLVGGHRKTDMFMKLSSEVQVDLQTYSCVIREASHTAFKIQSFNFCPQNYFLKRDEFALMQESGKHDILTEIEIRFSAFNDLIKNYFSERRMIVKEHSKLFKMLNYSRIVHFLFLISRFSRLVWNQQKCI